MKRHLCTVITQRFHKTHSPLLTCFCLSTTNKIQRTDVQRKMTYLEIVVAVVMAMVTMCSIIGNSVVFVVICWNHSIEKPLNLFLFNLAVADIGFSCTCIPYAIGQIVSKTNDINLTTLCLANAFIIALFAGASSLIIMAFCLYQYLVVSGPLDASISTLHSFIFIILAWLLAISVSIAPAFGLGNYEFSSSIFECLFPNRSGDLQRLVYNGLLMVTWYIMPLVSLSFCYILILLHLRDPDTRAVKGCTIASVANNDGCLETGQGRTARAVVVAYLVFVLFRTPLLVSTVLNTWNLVEPRWIALTDQIAFWAIYFHAASDPFVYALQHGEFTHTICVIWRTLKERFVECCCCCCCCFTGNIEQGQKLPAPFETKNTKLESVMEED